ncbi:hypothetical protein H072_21 [Dactylellina haptotyla CBS 200.50]|uniref:Heterokaryon incompatibility domain-containing protein n=1 Tax=Dactylellina haptotyla (strain CBS 200.50) TaxID=1284197 RepID=S8AY96_DACHA|nr:hypothetical protein H072_21 [Dactylellina haptotyla CBS 200.50]
MEHFLLPKGKRHLLIPNHTTNEYTNDGSGFGSYPSRMGWTPEDISGANGFGGRTKSEVEAFFQSWLYFGCIVEVFAVVGIQVQQSDFVDENGQFVSTRLLPFFIRQWRKKVQEIGAKDSPENMKSSMKIGIILHSVADFIDKYCLPYSGTRKSYMDSVAPSAKSPLSDLIWMSVIALGHTLMAALIQFYDIRRTGNHWGASRLLKKRLLRNGWCPSDIEKCMTDFGIDGHYYLSRCTMKEQNLTHKDCDKFYCRARQVNETTYEPKHVRGKDDCSGHIWIDTHLVASIIKDGKVPVFKWDSSTKTVEIAGSNLLRRGYASPPFVAISHVWSDGMGNPDGNGLLECKLNEIQELVKIAATKLKGNPQHFWMDTFGIPVGSGPEMKAARKSAIATMTGIYGAASGVLVLSSNLQAISSTDSDAEKGLGLYFTNWNRRLWTWQEGMLAKKLLLQFSNEPIDIYHYELKDGRRSVRRGHCVTFPKDADIAAMAQFIILRDFLRMGLFASMGAAEGRSGPIGVAVSQTQTRSTSHGIDETVCFGLMLGLDVMKLLNVEKNLIEEYRQKDPSLAADMRISDEEVGKARMKLFFSMVKVFPRDMVFSVHYRLDVEGFRWAPGSFLGLPARDFARHAEGNHAILDKYGRGLSVAGTGLRFRYSDAQTSSQPPNIILTVTAPGAPSFTLKVEVVKRHEADQPFNWVENKEYGIILDEGPGITVARYRDREIATEDRVRNGPDLEKWFENIFSVKQIGLAIDGVVGEILSESEEGADDKWIQIRHGCVAAVTILDPSAITPGPQDLLPQLNFRNEPYPDDEYNEYLDMIGSGDYVADPLAPSDDEEEDDDNDDDDDDDEEGGEDEQEDEIAEDNGDDEEWEDEDSSGTNEDDSDSEGK